MDKSEGRVKLIKDFDDFRTVKAVGQVREPTGEPYVYHTVYRYSEEQIRPLFNFVQTKLNTGSARAAELIAETKLIGPDDQCKGPFYRVTPELWELLTGEMV